MAEHLTEQLEGADSVDRVLVVDKIVGFLREIGLEVEMGAVPTSFLPGIKLMRNGLMVDAEKLLYPGDLLHEAGHLAVMTPERRNASQPAGEELGEEIAAQAWSYAAAVHLGLSPEVVFHQHGYKGQAAGLVAALSSTDGLAVIPGVPLLAWMGLTSPPTPTERSIFPQMLRWLREEEPPAT